MWDLSAPASQVLLTGAATPNNWAIKLALKELVLRRALTLVRIEKRRFLRSPKQIDVLALRRWPDREVGRSRIGVMEAFPKSQQVVVESTGVPIDVVAAEVMRWYRAGGGYVQGEVLPELEQRGFYRRIDEGQGIQWQVTASGAAKLEELRLLMERGTVQFPVWVRQDREQAVRFIHDAGPILLLLGNPAIWLWTVMTATFAGGELDEGEIPWDAGVPFPSAEGVGEAPIGGILIGVGTGEGGGTAEHEMDTGGGGGGFESPGEDIDSAIDDDADGGDGDGE
jgi:hypothetical protein